MEKFFKRTLSVFLATIIVFGFVPLGVFAQDTSKVQTITDDYEITTSTALGNVISQAMESYEVTSAAGYAISKIEFNGKIATVSMINADACKLVVAIYSEIGQMLGAGTADVNAATGTVDVTIDIKVMPEYFTAKGFLLDENMAALCESYTCIRYTKMFQDFATKTVDDFNEQKVIMFDESKDNNFAVLPDDAEVFDSDGSVNDLISIDNENGIYVFENADDSIKNLSAEQIFYFNDEANSIIIKVKSVSSSGSQTTVFAEEAELAELFEYIKINEEAYAGEDDLDTSTMDEGVTLIDVQPEKTRSETQTVYGTQPQDIDEDFVGSTKFNFKLKKEWKDADGIPFSVEGNVSLKVKIEIELYYDAKWGDDYFDFSFVASQETGGSISFNLPVKSKFDINLPSATVPLCGGVVQLKLQPKFVVSGKASLKIEFSKKEKLGFTFNSENDIRPINEQEAEYAPSTEAAVELKFGVEMGASADIIKIVNLKLTVGAGISIKGTLETQSLEHGSDTIHFCSYCINGDMKLYADFEIKFEVDIFGKVLFEPSYKDDFTLKFGDFYISINDENVKFGLGVCPDKAHKVTFEVTDKSGAAIPGATVSGADNSLKRFNNNNTNTVTDEIGKAIYYYTNGRYTATASAEKFIPQDKTFGVDNNTQTVEITLDPSKDGKTVVSRGNACSNYADSTKCNGKHLTYTFYSDGEFVISGNGEMHTNQWNGWGYTDQGEGFLPPWLHNNQSIRKKVKSIVIEEGVVSIGEYAFAAFYENLETVSFPESLISIGDYAFKGDEEWEVNVLTYGNNLKTIHIPKNVSEIGVGAFSACADLTNFTVDSNNKYFSSDSSGVLFSKDKKILIQYPAGKADQKYSIPSSVTEIGDGAFEGCKINEVILPYGVENIGYLAFSDCYKLKKMNLPDSLKSIGDYAFSSTGIENITIPNGLENIGEGVFSGSALTTLPAGLKSISGWMFYGCGNLTDITIPNGVTAIGESAFSFCDNLISITLPNSITDIGDSAFQSCYKLKSVLLPSNLSCISDELFWNCCELTDITIPNGVTEIGYGSFRYCVRLTIITLPKSITSIDSCAFEGCDALSNVYYSGNKNQWSAISIDEDNDYLLNATIHYNSSGTRSVLKQSLAEPQALVSKPAFASPSVSATYDSCIAGNSYIILYASGYSNPFELLSPNLFYIDQVAADENGSINLSFIPKSNENTAFTLIAGDFGNGKTELRVLSYPESPVFTAERISVNYRSNTKLPTTHPNVVYTSSDPSVVSVDEFGNISAKKTGSATITAKVIGTDIIDTCEVMVSYAWWQWIIKILLLGFLWY